MIILKSTKFQIRFLQYFLLKYDQHKIININNVALSYYENLRNHRIALQRCTRGKLLLTAL